MRIFASEMIRKRRKRIGIFGPGFVLCLSLAALGLLYFALWPFSIPSARIPEIFFEGIFFLIILVCAFIVLPHRRTLHAVAAGVVLLVLGAFSNFLHEFFKLPDLLSGVLEGLLLTMGALVTAVGLSRWTRQTSEQAAKNRQLLEEERSQRQQIDALGKLSTNIIGLLGDRKILENGLAARARKLLCVDAVCIRLAEPGGVPRVAFAGEEQYQALREARIETGMFARERSATEAPIITLHPKTDDRIPESYRALLDKLGAQSFFSAPLRVQNRLIGTMDGFTCEAHVLGSQEVKTISALAEQAALTIANADLLWGIKDSVTELEKLNRDLQLADRVRTEFVAAMSHELRTPLHIILGYAGLFMERLGTGASSAERRAFQAVYEQSQVLSNVVTNVLQMAKADTGNVVLDVSDFSLGEITLELYALVDQLKQDTGLEIHWKVDDKLVTMTTDRYKLERILENLIRNAFAFTSKGKLEIAIRTREPEDEVVFSISDTGIGIAQRDLNKIFEPFYRSQAPHRDGEQQGVGLGLSVAKKYVELMEGNIDVESRWGVGTTFTVTVPRVVSTLEGPSQSLRLLS